MTLKKKTINKLIDDMKNHRIFLLWIKLPHYRKLFTNESRVITLEYEPPKEDVTKKIRVMEFHSAPYETFYAITPPDDFEFDKMEVITIDPKTKQETKKEKSWKIKKSGDPYYFTESQNSVFIRINPSSPHQYLFKYSFKAKKTIIALPAFALGILTAGSILIVLSNNLFWFLEWCGTIPLCWITTPVEEMQTNFAIAIIAASLVLPRLIRNVEIRDSWKFWYVVPILLSALGLYL